MRRALDVAGATLLLAITSPVLAASALAIRLGDGGPVFYRQRRVGLGGREFELLKLRTMVVGAERQGAGYAVNRGDPRITKAGKVLRRLSIDELPQLWNVLKGDMSLVGPRPHPTDDFDQYSLEHLRRLDVMPGVTGLWQVTARRDPSFERNMALDLQYIENWSLWLDFQILLKTLPAVVAGYGE